MLVSPLLRPRCLNPPSAFSLGLIASILIGSIGQAAPAFPGAQGFGANSTGARGPAATVYFVTNLNDGGPGSFRDAVSGSNRYVVFRVGGIINIDARIVVKPNVTIAGQTAPGDGITIYGNGLSYSNANTTVTRYIRYRMGVGGDSGKDGITIADGHDMMFDHVSVSWGRDETFSINGTASNVTLQDCMIAQGLQTHSCGGLMQTDGGVSIVRCLYIDNHTRNPKVKGVNEFVNNVVYNWGGGGGYIEGDSDGLSEVNVINNYFINGPQTTISAFSRANANFHLYALGNVQDSNLNGALDGVVLPQTAYGPATWMTTPYAYPASADFFSAEEAYAHVIANVGCTKPQRDRVDRRFIAELQSLGTLGEIPTNENDAPINGPGPVAGGSAPIDTDNDGMPDSWETANGTNPNVADANNDQDGDGYPNIEDYLNALVGLDQSAAGTGLPVTYAAEAGVLTGGAMPETVSTGFHGTGYVKFSAKGGSVQFNHVQGGPAAGTRTLRLRFAPLIGPSTGRLVINGVAQLLSFPAGSAAVSWSTKELKVTLSSGATNTIRLESAGTSLPLVDELTVW